MAKYEDKPAVVEKEKPKYNLGTKQLQSLISAHLKYTGLVTSVKYEWSSAGAIVAVDEADVADLMSKRVGSSGCCGNNPDGNFVFQIV